MKIRLNETAEAAKSAIEGIVIGMGIGIVLIKVVEVLKRK